MSNDCCQICNFNLSESLNGHSCRYYKHIITIKNKISESTANKDNFKKASRNNLDNFLKIKEEFSSKFSEVIGLLESVIEAVSNIDTKTSNLDSKEIKNDDEDFNPAAVIPKTLFFNDSKIYTKDNIDTVFSFSSKEPIKNTVTCRLNKSSNLAYVIIGLCSEKMDEKFSSKYTGEHGTHCFGVLATGSICENRSWKSKPWVKYGPGDSITFIREGTKVNVQVNNNNDNDYWYEIGTTGDLYLSCSSYSRIDEFEIIG